MRSILIPMVAAAATFALPAAAATVSIDSFGTNQIVQAPGLTNTNPNSNTTSDTGAIGGERTIYVERESGPLNITGAVFGGSATVSTDSLTQGFAIFSWMPTAADLLDTSNDRVRIGVSSYDVDTVYDLAVNGTSVQRNVTSVGNLDFMFSEFSGVEFSNVNSISLTISGPAGFDTTFEFIEATTVPLPAGGLLLIGGLGALGAARRRKTA